MNGLLIIAVFLILFTGTIHSQHKVNNWNTQVSPWVLGQVKVKAEFARSGTISFGTYVRYSWRSETLDGWWRIYKDYGGYKGLRIEPFARIYLLPRERNPLNGYYLQASTMYGRYSERKIDSRGIFWEGPKTSAGAGFKTGFQKVIGIISIDMGLGCKFLSDVKTLDLPDSWWLGPGCPVSADLLIGIRF